MKELHVPYCESLDFSNNARIRIEEFGWKKNDYMPDTVFYLCWNSTGLAVKAEACETRLRMENKEDGGDVWHDSCMEFFFGPAEEEHRYINLEVNPIGTMVMGFGGEKGGRQSLVQTRKQELELKVQAEEGKWTVSYFIPFSMLQEVFQLKDEELPVRELRANFYKCGEKTEAPHYGMWCKVENEVPDFHRPEFFGRLLLA